MKQRRLKSECIYADTYVLREPYVGCMLYLLVGQESALLIDTGIGIVDLRAAVQSLTDKPVSAVNTHGHLDHIANNHQFDHIYLNEKDREVFRLHTTPSFVNVMAKKELSSLLLFLLRRRLDNLLNHKPDGEYHYIHDGHVFDLGGRKVEVIETPGHTPGSICLLDEKTGALFTGDTVCDWGILLNLDYSRPPEVYLESMKKLQSCRARIANLHPGHRHSSIDPGYIDKYQHCAEGILDGSLPIQIKQSKKAEFKEAHFEDICLRFKEDYT
jgi:glyoxylase-like metal-dependent hydrolase (beta-lactamase superfamily II)